MTAPDHTRAEIAHLTGDLGELPEDWEGVPTYPRQLKTRVTLRLDREVEGFFRDMGPGWQTRLNQVLRLFVVSRRNPSMARHVGAQTVARNECPNCKRPESTARDLANLLALRLRVDIGQEGRALIAAELARRR